jgi:hypothetical protein
MEATTNSGFPYCTLAFNVAYYLLLQTRTGIMHLIFGIVLIALLILLVLSTLRLTWLFIKITAYLVIICGFIFFLPIAWGIDLYRNSKPNTPKPVQTQNIHGAINFIRNRKGTWVLK